MALFTDGSISELSDLQNQENAILDVASVENIDATAKMALAQKEIGKQLLKLLLRYPLRDYKTSSRRVVGVSDVVVTDPLRQWHTLKSLAFLYRDAYNNQLNDRYLGKWNEYQKLEREAADDYLEIGVGLVANPVPKAETPGLSAVPATTTGGTFYAAVAWLNAAGQEGLASDIAALAISDGAQLAVTPAAAPGNAAGWNVYVGNAPQGISLQNTNALALGATWSGGGALRQGPRPGRGQAPERYVVNERALLRG